MKSTPKTQAIAKASEPSAARKTRPGRPAANAAAKPGSKASAKALPEMPSKAAAGKSAPEPKPELVRDSFTIPKPEYAVLEALKLRAAKLERPIKKGELLRAGIGALNAMRDKAFLAALGAVPSLKTGRPKRAVAGGAD